MAGRIARVAAVVVVLIVAGGCISLGMLAPRDLQVEVVSRSPRWLEPNRIALVDVGGFIGLETGWLGGGTSVADVKEKLERATEDRRVKAVVLRIDSPGGGAAASDMIYSELLRFRKETGKPVVAMLMGTAASGGYYVALGADEIVASPTVLTGSVGVVMHLFNVEGLFGKLGVGAETIKSGEKKDIASFTRAMTEEERQVLQGIGDSLFAQFLEAVRASRRDVSAEDIAAISDGRPLTARQALKLHLIDRIGYMEDALAEARRLAGIPAADVILYRPHRHYNTNVYARAPQGPGPLEQGLGALLSRRTPTFLYLWEPGL